MRLMKKKERLDLMQKRLLNLNEAEKTYQTVSSAKQDVISLQSS